MMAVCVRLCGCLLLLLRSVGVGGDEVFEIQDRAGLAAANRGRLNRKAVMGCFESESVKWLRLPAAVRDVLKHAPRACACA